MGFVSSIAVEVIAKKIQRSGGDLPDGPPNVFAV
jgi:hypothetical protein